MSDHGGHGGGHEKGSSGEGVFGSTVKESLEAAENLVEPALNIEDLMGEALNVTNMDLKLGMSLAEALGETGTAGLGKAEGGDSKPAAAGHGHH